MSSIYKPPPPCISPKYCYIIYSATFSLTILVPAVVILMLPRARNWALSTCISILNNLLANHSSNLATILHQHILIKALISHESINIIYTQIGFTKRYCATLMQSENCTWIGIQQPANISKTSKCICIFQVVQSLSIHSFLVFLPLPRLAQTVRVYVVNLQFPEWEIMLDFLF